MEYRNLGSTDLKASVLGLGGWEFGDKKDFGTGDQREVDAVVGMALDSGINFFDTAEGYAGGQSEEMLGKALGGRRDQAIIATKFCEFGDWTKEMITDNIKASLKRLNVDTIDLFQMHWPKSNFTESDGEIMMAAFDEAVKNGDVRHVGVSNFHKTQLDLLTADARAKLVTNQIPLSLLWRHYDVDDTTGTCEANNISYIPYSPIAQGLLTGKFTLDNPPQGGPTANSKWSRDEIYPRTMTMVDVLKDVASKCDKSPAQVALNWAIHHPCVGTVIAGTRKTEHLQDNLGAVGWTLDAELTQQLEQASMVYQDCLDPEWASIWG